MKVAIVGYGRMGHEIETILRERGHRIVATIDPVATDASAATVSAESLNGAEMVVEFSLPAGVAENASVYARAACSAVVGTTGWERDRETVAETIAASGLGYLVGANFSIGANLFFRLTEAFATAVNVFEEYDVAIQETHHNKKKDSPSGTALTAAQKALGRLDRKTSIVTEALHREIAPDELHVSSTRIGSVPGTHTILADSPADTIELTHRARNRSGFALGAVLAAEWLLGKEGWYDVDDFIDSVLSQ